MTIMALTLQLNGQTMSPFVVSTAGGISSAGGVSLSWTAGELAIETRSAGSLILTEGFQQTDLKVVSAGEIMVPGFDIRVYPNPATDFIRVEWTRTEGNMRVELYDLVGRRLKMEQTDSDNTYIQIDLRSLTRSTYLLKVIKPGGDFSRTYRIVKR